ncbi:hypothetical protein AAFF_G00000450, partial [Aldrovandia affinis]
TRSPHLKCSRPNCGRAGAVRLPFNGLRPHSFALRVYTAEERMGKAPGHLEGPTGEGRDTESPCPADISTGTHCDSPAVETASGLGADLLELYQRGHSSDISIQVGERVFPAHRSVKQLPGFKRLGDTRRVDSSGPLIQE